MLDYSKGKIYKIVCDATDEIYVGSTIAPLYKRLSVHKRQRPGRHSTTSISLFEKGNCEIILIEDYPCERKEQLHSRERYWIENLENVINKCRPTRTIKEWAEDNKEHLDIYRKEYYETNKEKRKVDRKKNYENNRERDIKRATEWNKQNIEKRREKILCEVCGELKAKTAIRRHQQSIKCRNHTNLQDSSPIIISGV
jgi:hypothetical protein